MKYKIGDYISKNDKVIKIVDFEIINGFNIYYFSDKTSNEESKFDIIGEKELSKLLLEKVFSEFPKHVKNTAKKINEDYVKWLDEKKRKSSLSYKFQKFIKNTLGF